MAMGELRRRRNFRLKGQTELEENVQCGGQKEGTGGRHSRKWRGDGCISTFKAVKGRCEQRSSSACNQTLVARKRERIERREERNERQGVGSSAESCTQKAEQ
jgi:hypothetical protein